MNSAFADVTITTASGSGAPGCEDTSSGCFIPSTAKVNVSEKVIFSNTDGAAHTFTSGDPTMPETVQLLFDSGLAMAGSTFEWTATEIGDVPYFCMVHPWMQGLIIVQEVKETQGTEAELTVIITDTIVENKTQIHLDFSLDQVNYEIIATQSGKVILQDTGHAEHGTAINIIDTIGSDVNPISIEIISLGIGYPDKLPPWTGPFGTVDTSQVVPEFGTIAMMILAVAIISIVAVTSKSRIIPRF